ncbi:hypothetical protein [Desulfosediminicola flagellatus]|uniref:hypothetical protein n=1 Tax=Desulfosediminicola flagellatus TaxID=2569541 RepID=UPI001C3CF880|nr:hypothetical protein [Desulfosediminicola flagellatus]
MARITIDDLMAGGNATHEIELPLDFLGNGSGESVCHTVVLRPLTVLHLQKVSRGITDDENLAASMMIHLAMVDPELSLEQAMSLPAGTARNILDNINRISGLSTPRDELDALVSEPLARACYILGKEFGWTVQEVSGLTIGQILLYLQMINNDRQAT